MEKQGILCSELYKHVTKYNKAAVLNSHHDANNEHDNPMTLEEVPTALRTIKKRGMGGGVNRGR